MTPKKTTTPARKKEEQRFSDREKQAFLILIATVLLYFGENFWFGWNNTAQSPFEGICDFFVIIGLFVVYLWKPTKTVNQTTNFIVAPKLAK